MTDTQSEAIRHLAVARSEAEKGPSGQTIRAIRKVGVIGAGTMGTGIAMAMSNAGLPVMLMETSEQALARGLGMIRKNYDATAGGGRLTAEQVEERMARITGRTDMDGFRDVDLIVEAVFEDMKVKLDFFRQLDAIAPSDAILTTNTSRLDVNEIARATSRPQSVVGMHFFSPAHVMKLLEVVRGTATDPAVLATVMALAKQIGKQPVLVGVCDGFVGNRMVSHYTREAQFLVVEVARWSQ